MPDTNVEVGPPRIVIGFVQGELLPETRAIGGAMNATFVDMTGDDCAYFSLMERLWAAGEAFILCEQDVAPTRALLQEMWDCPREWCSGFFYLHGGVWKNGQRSEVMPGETRPVQPERYWIAGTTALHRFSTRLLARTPHAMEDASRGGGQRYHTQLDLSLVHPGGVLHGAYRARPHLHGPVSQPTRVPPPWVASIGDDEWIESGDYGPNIASTRPASEQCDNHGAPFFERITKESDECR